VFGGLPEEILKAAVARTFVLCTSPEIRDEVESTLLKKFEWPSELVRLACGPLWECALDFVAGDRLSIVAADPDDNALLECAIAADANLLVTGDNHLLNLIDKDLEGLAFRRGQILTIREFLNRRPFPLS
jgi:predicted nucleic acid-binding protein